MRSFILMMFLFFVCTFAMAADTVPPAAEQVPLWMVIIGLVYAVIEYILGKTTWIKPNSVIDVIIQVVFKILKALLPEKK